MREVADQIPHGIGPERLAQLQQAVAQAVAGLLGALMQPQEIGQSLATDRPAPSARP